MRLVCVLLTLGPPLEAGEDASIRTPVVIGVEVQNGLPVPAIEEMQSELSRLFTKTFHELRVGPLDGSLTSGASAETLHQCLHGECRLKLEPFLLDERGLYAITYVSDGRLLSFAEVDCRRRGAHQKEPSPRSRAPCWDAVIRLAQRSAR